MEKKENFNNVFRYSNYIKTITIDEVYGKCYTTIRFFKKVSYENYYYMLLKINEVGEIINIRAPFKKYTKLYFRSQYLRDYKELIFLDDITTDIDYISAIF